MKPSVCVVGGATWDVMFTTSQADLVTPRGRAEQPVLAFPYGGKVDARDVVYGFGGGAANVSLGLSALGSRAAIVTRVGADWRGGEVVKNLRAHGVDTRGVQRDAHATTALAFIVTAGGAHDHVAFVSRGASTHVRVPASLPVGCRWAYVTALATPNWYASLAKLFRAAARRGQHIFWNPGARQLAAAHKVRALARYVAVLDVNDDEARRLARELKLNATRPGDLARALHRFGCGGVLVTCGRVGAYYFDGKKLTFRSPCQVTPVNTTGAGDAFGSGWLAGYLASGGSVREAMEWGMLNATSVIMHKGAQRGLLTLRGLTAFRKRYGK